MISFVFFLERPLPVNEDIDAKPGEWSFMYFFWNHSPAIVFIIGTLISIYDWSILKREQTDTSKKIDQSKQLRKGHSHLRNVVLFFRT